MSRLMNGNADTCPSLSSNEYGGSTDSHASSHRMRAIMKVQAWLDKLEVSEETESEVKKVTVVVDAQNNRIGEKKQEIQNNLKKLENHKADGKKTDTEEKEMEAAWNKFEEEWNEKKRKEKEDKEEQDKKTAELLNCAEVGLLKLKTVLSSCVEDTDTDTA